MCPKVPMKGKGTTFLIYPPLQEPLPFEAGDSGKQEGRRKQAAK